MRSLILSLLVLSSQLLPSEILEWEWAMSTSAAREICLTSVESPGFKQAPSATFASGYFLGDVSLPGYDSRLSSDDRAGLVVRMDRSDSSQDWKFAWVAQPNSKGAVEITDLAVDSPRQLIYVTGFHEGDLTLGDDIMLPAPDGQEPQGFVATLSPADGRWLNAFALKDLLPSSLAIDAEGSIFLTGTGRLLARYLPDGELAGEVESPEKIATLNHVALFEPQEGKPYYYVLGSVIDDGNLHDVYIACVDSNFSILWQTAVTSPANDLPGGLAVSSSGRVTFSLDSPSPDVNYRGKLLDEPTGWGSRETYVVNLSLEGELQWSRRVADAVATKGSMTSRDLALDPRGNIHVAINFDGGYFVEGLTRYGSSDTGIASLDAEGNRYDFRQSTGHPEATGLGIAAPGFVTQILVGHFTGSGQEVFDAHPLEADEKSPKAFAAFTRNKANQSCFLVRQPDGDQTPPEQFLNELLAILQQQPNATLQLSQPAQVYLELNYPDIYQSPTGFTRSIVGYAAFISLTDVDALQSSDRFVVEEDAEIALSGTTSPSSWNLAKLNNQAATNPPGYSYEFPEMCQPVRLYLIDTAVNDPNSYFSSNSYLTLLDDTGSGFGELIRGEGDAEAIGSMEHGTHMASLIAGPGHGVAQETDLTLKIYDIYPNAGTTRASYLTSALSEAYYDRISSQNLYTPAAIVIASTSATTISPTDPAPLDTAMGIALDSCLLAGIPVVMAAGNSSADAADYYPSVFGDLPGVICTGATNESDAVTALSNTGAKVKLMAPGHENVAVDDEVGQASTELFSGTSASAATVAGVLAQYYSANPWQRGSSLVNNFLADCTHAITVMDASGSYPVLKSDPGLPPCTTSYNDWTTWFGLADPSPQANDDGDLYTNLEEYIYGLNPHEFEGYPHVFGIREVSGPTLTLGFPVAWWLWDPDEKGPSFQLRDGSSNLTLRSSTDLATFSDRAVSLSEDGDCLATEYLTFEIDTSTKTEQEFFRLLLK
ncbi:MAG: S8 family serine peptidase [Verrucomicrobiota bacterium JB023]|nr:S8 family serine peptidase [Verrucomicrobiota bacterium JB023]